MFARRLQPLPLDLFATTPRLQVRLIDGVLRIGGGDGDAILGIGIGDGDGILGLGMGDGGMAMEIVMTFWYGINDQPGIGFLPSELDFPVCLTPPSLPSPAQTGRPPSCL